METQEGKDGGKECCTKGACCGGKALIAFALLALGAVGGYFCGRNCTAKSCGMPSASAPAAAPSK